MVSSESRRWRARLFQRHGPATVNVRVLGTSHVATFDDQSLAAGGSGKLRQVLWRQVIQHLVKQNRQLKFYTLLHW